MVLGGFLAAAAALLAGASGFGFGLVATPALLLTGFALRFVITVNLLLTVATRASVAWRFRHAVQPRHAAVLVGFGVPGLWVGSRTLGAVDEHVLKLVVGVAVALAAAALALADRRPLRRAIPGMSAAAGFLGGLLGTTTSLIGVPPALLLVRRRLPTETFFADWRSSSSPQPRSGSPSWRSRGSSTRTRPPPSSGGCRAFWSRTCSARAPVSARGRGSSADSRSASRSRVGSSQP